MKRVFKVVIFGVCLGLLLLVIQQGLQIDRDLFMRYYWLIGSVVVLGAVLINVGYNLSYQRQMAKIAKLLDAGRTDEYLAGLEKLLQTARGKNLRSILQINLAAGYIEAKQFAAAVELLEGLDTERLKGRALKMVYRLNLCLSYFGAAQYDKAMAAYNAGKKDWDFFRSNKDFGGNIALLDILAQIQQKNFDQAKSLLAETQSVWANPRLQAYFQQIDNFIQEQKTI